MEEGRRTKGRGRPPLPLGAMGKSQVFKWEEKGESLDEGAKEVLEEIKKIVVYK
jgi:hypothetical protein